MNQKIETESYLEVEMEIQKENRLNSCQLKMKLLKVWILFLKVCKLIFSMNHPVNGNQQLLKNSIEYPYKN